MGAMLLLVLGNNYLVTFVGWEGVGLCSYLLIGFYYDQEFPPYAGRKAFIVNRIGDFAFIVGLFAIVANFGSLRVQRSDLARGGRPCGREPALLDGLVGGGVHRAVPVRRRDGQVGADPALRLAARRDGRPDAGLGADPRRHHGDGGRLHGGALERRSTSSRPGSRSSWR